MKMETNRKLLFVLKLLDLNLFHSHCFERCILAYNRLVLLVGETFFFPAQSSCMRVMCKRDAVVCHLTGNLHLYLQLFFFQLSLSGAFLCEYVSSFLSFLNATNVILQLILGYAMLMPIKSLS